MPEVHQIISKATEDSNREVRYEATKAQYSILQFCVNNVHSNQHSWVIQMNIVLTNTDWRKSIEKHTVENTYDPDDLIWPLNPTENTQIIDCPL